MKLVKEMNLWNVRQFCEFWILLKVVTTILLLFFWSLIFLVWWFTCKITIQKIVALNNKLPTNTKDISLWWFWLEETDISLTFGKFMVSEQILTCIFVLLPSLYTCLYVFSRSIFIIPLFFCLSSNNSKTAELIGL